MKHRREFKAVLMAQSSLTFLWATVELMTDYGQRNRNRP